MSPLSARCPTEIHCKSGLGIFPGLNNRQKTMQSVLLTLKYTWRVCADSDVHNDINVCLAGNNGQCGLIYLQLAAAAEHLY